MNIVRKLFCKRNHNKNITGRTKTGSCKECQKLYRQEHKKKSAANKRTI